MADIYSVLFGEVTVAATSRLLVFTVPAGRVAVLRDIDALSVGVTPAQFLIENYATSSSYWGLTSPTALGSVQWQGRQVFPAGEGIGVFVVAGTWNVRLSGYLLTAP